MKQLNFRKGSIKNNNFGITLIALVVTIIVLLILAGISISMLSGDNSILQRATDAKERTERASIIEQARTDILAKIAENKGENISKEQLVAVLNQYFKPTETTSIPDEVSSTKDIQLTTVDDKYNIHLSEIFNGSISSENNVVTLGQQYENSWIGKQITYLVNGVSDWIILGEDDSGDILITTTNPIGSYTSKWGSEHIDEFTTDLQSECAAYKGKIGTKNIDVQEVRSISKTDIDNTVEISEDNKNIIFSDGSDYWVSYVDSIGALTRAYYVGNHSLYKMQVLYSSAQYMGSTSRTCKIRPVVILSAGILWDDVKDLIGDYVEY